MADQAPEPLPPGYELHQFIIERELQPGGMGRFYKARMTPSGDTCAINVLASHLRSTEGARRFRELFRRTFYSRRGQAFSYGEWLGIPYVVVAYSEETDSGLDIASGDRLLKE